MKESVKVAAVQVARGEDKKQVGVSLKLCDKAVESGAQIVCFGEFMIDSEPVDGSLMQSYQNKAKEHSIYLITSIKKALTEKSYTVFAYLIDPEGKIIGTYEKVHGGGGKTLPVFETSFCKIGIMICYDKNFPEVARAFAIQGASIVFCPTASSFPDDITWTDLLKIRALENSLFVVGANRVGPFIHNNKQYYNFGRSVIFDPLGRCLAEAGSLTDEIITVELNLELLKQMRECKDIEEPNIRSPLVGRKPEVYREYFKE